MTLKVNLPKAIIKPAKKEQPYDYAAKCRQQAETIDGQYFEGMRTPTVEGYEKFADIDSDGSGDLSFEEIMTQRDTELAALRMEYWVLNPIVGGVSEFFTTGSIKNAKARSKKLSSKIDNLKETSKQLWADYKAGKKPNMLRKQPGETQTLSKPQQIYVETLINKKV